MSRLKRFEDQRFVGDRRSMVVYDCDDAAQFESLAGLVEAHDLATSNQLQTFAPDELTEALNRSFVPARQAT